MELNGQPAIAWALTLPAYRTAGGRNMKAKHARIMVIHDLVILGQGLMDNKRMRFSVMRFHTPESAQIFAMGNTAHWERKGYNLTIEPMILNVDKANVTERLYKKVHTPSEPDGGLYSSFVHIFNHGKPLELVSP